MQYRNQPQLAIIQKRLFVPCGKCMALAVLDVDDFKRPRVALSVCHNADTTQVMTSSHHANISYKTINNRSINTDIMCHGGRDFNLHYCFVYIKADVKEFLEEGGDKWSRQGIHGRKWLSDKRC